MRRLLTNWSKRRWHEGASSMSTVVRRGSKPTPRPRKRAPRKTVRQVSWLDRLLQSLPFTQAEVQRFLTYVILAVLLIAALLVWRKALSQGI